MRNILVVEHDGDDESLERLLDSIKWRKGVKDIAYKSDVPSYIQFDLTHWEHS